MMRKEKMDSTMKSLGKSSSSEPILAHMSRVMRASIAPRSELPMMTMSGLITLMTNSSFLRSLFLFELRQASGRQ